MLQRILVAVVGIPLLLFVLIIAPDWATAALLCALCAVGAHELLAAACSKDITRRWWGLSAIMGVTVVLRTYLAGIGEDGAAALMTWLLAAWLVLLFVSVVVEYGTARALAFRDVCTILAAGVAMDFIVWMDYTSPHPEKSFGLLDEETNCYIELPMEWEGNLKLTDSEQYDGAVELRTVDEDQLVMTLRLVRTTSSLKGWTRLGIVASRQMQAKLAPDVEISDKNYRLSKALHLLN